MTTVSPALPRPATRRCATNWCSSIGARNRARSEIRPHRARQRSRADRPRGADPRHQPFDPEREVRFSTYAARVIDGRLKQHFRDDGWDIRVPRSIKQLAVAVRSTTSEQTNELGRVPSPAELAYRLGVTVDQIAHALDAANAHRADDLDSDPSSDETWDAVDTGLDVPELLDGLPEQERSVVSLRFYGELSECQIAERIGVCQMQVSLMLRRALTRLRTEIGDA